MTLSLSIPGPFVVEPSGHLRYLIVGSDRQTVALVFGPLAHYDAPIVADMLNAGEREDPRIKALEDRVVAQAADIRYLEDEINILESSECPECGQ